MPRHLPVVFVALSIAASDAAAQSLSPAWPLTQQVSASGGRLYGVVRDEGGHAVGGVSVLAMGTTLASVKSDGHGEFSLALPIGEYVLRAAREGYLSTYREAVRVQTSAPLERNITLVRLGARADATPAGAPGPAEPPTPGPAPLAVPELAESNDAPERASSEAAWRLRHLTRTVLRDTSPIATMAEDDAEGRLSPAESAFRGSAAHRPARAAASFFTAADLGGQVNLLTTSTLATTSGWIPQTMPHGIAYVALGAPLGASGDWSVRAAMGAGSLPSWTIAGEYSAQSGRSHAYRFGVSYGTQALLAVSDNLAELGPNGSRNVGGFFGSDRWRIGSVVEVDYGLRFDRYDYLVEPDLVSPRVGARVRVAPGTSAVVSASDRQIAPGADEFLPPSSSGAWLPPERTFSSLSPDAPLRSERVRRYEVGLEQRFGAARSRAVGVHWFSETTTDQVSTIFGLDSASEVGHYYVAVVGDVHVEGWKIALAGDMHKRLRGTVEYAVGEAQWTAAPGRNLRHVAPSAARRTERLQDLTTSLEAAVLETATHIAISYRVNTRFSADDRFLRRPLTDGRFDLEVRQELPYQPIRHGKINAVFAIRTMLRDVDSGGSFYDELLTVAPPRRMTCGFQVTF